MTDEQTPTAPADTLRQRLADAVDDAWRTSLETHAFGPRARAEITDAVLAVVQPELDRLHEEHAESIASLADVTRNRNEWQWRAEEGQRTTQIQRLRAEQVEAVIDRVLALAIDVDTPDWRAPGTEVAARIRLALGEETPAATGANEPDAHQQAEAWRRKAVRRALKISKLQGTLAAVADLASEQITARTEWGDGYRSALADLQEVLREFEPPAPEAAEAPAPAWVADTAQTGVATPGCDCGHDGMGLKWHRADCVWRHHQDCGRCDVTDPCPCCGLQIQPIPDQQPAPAVSTGLVVQPYRTDRGDPAWVFRCWGTDTCDGWLSLDHSSRQSAERARDRHVAEAHAEPPAPDAGPTVREAADHDRRWWNGEKAGE